jgi:AmmeMemoRadiSam system protein A
MAPEENLTESERAFLLKLARDSITATLKKADLPKFSREQLNAVGPHLEEPRGCFVTLHKRHQLRGCIGTFYGEGPLWTNIVEMAVSAAFQDPRFSKLRESELKEIDLEISVLSPLRVTKHPEEIKVGVHGIFITRGRYRGVLLPQVATEQGWDRETFLEHTCIKAGLPTDAWKDPSTQIELFTAEVFGEKENPTGCL